MMTFAIVLFILLIFVLVCFNYIIDPRFNYIELEQTCKENYIATFKFEQTNNFVNAMMRRKRRRLKIKKGAVF